MRLNAGSRSADQWNSSSELCAEEAADIVLWRTSGRKSMLFLGGCSMLEVTLAVTGHDAAGLYEVIVGHHRWTHHPTAHGLVRPDDRRRRGKDPVRCTTL
jgi:hypothetical protein